MRRITPDSLVRAYEDDLTVVLPAGLRKLLEVQISPNHIRGVRHVVRIAATAPGDRNIATLPHRRRSVYRADGPGTLRVNGSASRLLCEVLGL